MIQEKDIIKFGKQTIKSYNKIKNAISVQQDYIKKLVHDRNKLQVEFIQENRLNREKRKNYVIR